MNGDVENGIQLAIAACLKHAKIERCLDIQDISKAMGMPTPWVLYKWIEGARIPAVMVPIFEEACGATFLSQCLAEAAGLTVFKATPQGISRMDWAQANLLVAKAMAEAAANLADPDHWREAIQACNQAMSALASVRQQLSNGAEHG